MLVNGLWPRFLFLPENGTLPTMSVTRQSGVREQLPLHDDQRGRILTTLVGNLSHDLNNLLTVLSCNTDLLLADDRLQGEQRVMLQEMAEAARQAGELTTALQSFSRRPSMSPSRCQLGETLAEMGRLLRHGLPDNVELSVECPDDLPAVWADTGQLQHALMILCVRAGLAMTDGGRLSLTASKSRPEGESSGNMRTSSEYVVLSVEHSGRRLNELFDDPTCAASADEASIAAAQESAMGGSPNLLDLGVVRDTIKRHQGWIDAADIPGDSHRYDIHWPVAPADDQRSAETMPTGAGTILVMDNDPMGRAVICSAVEKGGYRSITAADPESAGQLLVQHAGQLRVAIVRLPEQESRARSLLAQIREMEPPVSIIVLSRADADSDPANSELVVHLREPFGPREILEAVGRVDSAGETLRLRRTTSSSRR